MTVLKVAVLSGGVGGARFTRGLRSLLGDDHPPYPLFSVGLAEANELPAPVVADELRRRRDREESRRAELAARHATATSHGLPRRYALDVERDLAVMAAEIAWLDETIAELERGELDWDSPFPTEYKAKKAAARSRAARENDTSSTTEPKDTP